VLEASPTAVVAVDAEGRISYVNPQVETTFGYGPDELLGEPVEKLLPDRLQERHVAHRQGFIAQPTVRPMGIGLDLAGRHKNGREFPVEISLSPVATADDLQVFATVVDISARKMAEEELLQAQKLESIGRLAGGIAHDFNNVLFAISGYAELLEQDLSAGEGGLPDVESAQSSVRGISQAAQRAAALTAQLLAFSRQQVVSPRVVDLKAAVHALEPMLRRLIGENVKLVLSFGLTEIRVRADPGQLDQIVLNLVLNARDAMPHGGILTVEIGAATFSDRDALEHRSITPGRYAVLAVTDTGEGMDERTRERIFEPFFTTKEQGKGTGLGLATIYGIVRQAGGHIWVYSELGHGTVFKLHFPLVEDELAERERPAAAEATGPRRGKGDVLVVEDDPTVRTMITQLLERGGYSVTALSDSASALERIDSLSEELDALVTDVIMPGVSGIDLAEQVLERRPDVGVVLLSGYTAETLNLERVMGKGAAFVSKPVASQDLISAIGRVMRTNTRPRKAG
jgi:two-component system, cell cycle sensor histidine kinase and response regulator CckA